MYYIKYIHNYTYAYIHIVLCRQAVYTLYVLTHTHTCTHTDSLEKFPVNNSFKNCPP